MSSEKRMWGVLIHLGMNQWHDHYMDRIKRAGNWAGIPNDDYLEHIRRQYQTADHVRFDEATWREVSESYAKNGVNTIVLDLGEAFAYPSHPELWVKGSWSVEKRGSRAWMWIDHIAEQAEETKAFERLPKKTMMSPWYYHLEFDPAKTWEIRVMHDLDRHGYDMIPCGSICFFDNDSVERLSEYCEAHFDKTRLFGYLNAPWLEMNAFFKDRLILAGESVGRARKAVER